MSDNVYKIINVVGSSTKSFEDAIQQAISKAAGSVRNMRWFEVERTHGHIVDNKVAHFQVTMKIGFTID